MQEEFKMGILEKKLKDYVWENFALFHSIFSEKVYKILLQYRTKNDKNSFNNTLEAIIEVDSELLIKIEKKYKFIYDMTIEEIVDILKIDFSAKDKYIDRAWYLIESYKNKDENFINLLMYLSSYYNNTGDYAQALNLAERAKDNYYKEDAIMIGIYNNLAQLYHSLGEYKKSLKFYNKILNILDEDNFDINIIHNNLALLYNSIGEYSKALSLLIKVLKNQEVSLDKNHPSFASTYNNLALVYTSMGEYEKALSFYQKTLEIEQIIYAEIHPDMATTYDNLSYLYNLLGKYDKALSLSLKALKIHQELLGENHPDTARNYNNLAEIYSSKREYKKALKFYQKSLKISIKIFGENHPNIAVAYGNIGSLYSTLNEYHQAEEFYKKSLSIHINTLGENHPDTATSYNNLGELYTQNKNNKEALPLLKKSLKIQENFLDKNHPHLATTYNNLALIYASKKEYEEALNLYTKALLIDENTLGKNHPNTISIYNNLSKLYLEMKEYEKAESFYYKVLEAKEENSNVVLTPKQINDFYQIDSTYLEAIKIKEYFSIVDMEIEDLKGKKEIYFVGENGDGKTVLLQAIALALKGDEYEILAEDYIKNIKNNMELSTKDSRYPNEYKNYKNVKNLFAYGINRNKVSSNEEDTNVTSYSGLFDTPSIYKTTLLKDVESFLLQETDLVKEFKKQMSFLMDEKFQIIKTDNGLEYGDIKQFSMLSEGYKTTLIWLSDLVSRLIENDKENEVQKLADFKAIVLIDEVDLYLHPRWKYDFMNKLRNIFQNIQFIMTTHSLVTILGASEDAVFYKVYKEGGETKVAEQVDNISYYTSDILMTSPLFNLKTIKSRQFDERERVSSDDYIYHRIHKKIKKQLNETPSATDEDVDSWLDDAFDEEFGE